MVEAATFSFTAWDKIPELEVPYLCETWTWQGDTSVLPHKWSEVISSVTGKEVSSKELKENYVKHASFDPDGFYFITYRSHAIGIGYLWPSDT